MQHLNKHTYNIYQEKQMKHLEQTFATYVYSHCNICNIPIYFCNVHIKHLQHISETLGTYTYNMRFYLTLADGWAGGALHSGIRGKVAAEDGGAATPRRKWGPG